MAIKNSMGNGIQVDLLDYRIEVVNNLPPNLEGNLLVPTESKTAISIPLDYMLNSVPYTPNLTNPYKTDYTYWHGYMGDNHMFVIGINPTKEPELFPNRFMVNNSPVSIPFLFGFVQQNKLFGETFAAFMFDPILAKWEVAPRGYLIQISAYSSNPENNAKTAQFWTDPFDWAIGTRTDIDIDKEFARVLYDTENYLNDKRIYADNTTPFIEETHAVAAQATDIEL
jgi:hypothetical protein